MSRLRSRAERAVVIHGIIAVLLVLVVLQLWLFAATMNAWLGGDTSVVWPAAGASAACLGLCLGLLAYLHVLERT